jgi:cytochrome c peroxidase
MKKVLFLLLAISAVALFSCKHDPIDGSTVIDNDLQALLRSTSPTGEKDYYILPTSTELHLLPQDPKNPLTWQKVELGKMLFFETGIGLEPNDPSAVGTYSCGSCHIPSAGFLPRRPQGIADGGIGFGLEGEGRQMSPVYDEYELDVQGARPLSVLNVAYVTNTFWNGQFGGNNVNEGTEHLWDADPVLEVNKLGYFGLESQNIEGLEVHRMLVNKDIADTLGYAPYFDRAFPEFDESERYSNLTASLAISAYLRTLTTSEAPFQKYLRGNHGAMSEQQKRGAMLFFGEARCYYCHKSPALQSNEFHAMGVKGMYQQDNPLATDKSDPRNLGRGGFTQDVADYYKFQVPQLYNLKNAGFYFHGASKTDLRDVIEYKSKAEPENPDVPVSQISSRFTRLDLNEQEIDDLTEFVKNGLYDPNLDRHVPPFILSGNCFPNNDPMSKVHLGCE